MKVILKTFQEADELVFDGSEKDAKIMAKTLDEYHRWDSHIDIILVPNQIPTYKTLDEFLEVYEYQQAFNETTKLS